MITELILPIHAVQLHRTELQRPSSIYGGNLVVERDDVPATPCRALEIAFA